MLPRTACARRSDNGGGGVPLAHLTGVTRDRPASGLPMVYRLGVGAKMIKVDEQTHARLIQLAAENGTTIGGFVAGLVQAQRTRAEWADIAHQTADYLHEQFGFVATPEEQATAEAWLTRQPDQRLRRGRASS
jgi:hypothetical protein